MGVHAYLLEPGWCTPKLLPQHDISCQPRALNVQMEPLRFTGIHDFVPLCILDLGYD